MKKEDKIYRLSDNNIGTILEVSGMDLIRVQWNDGSLSTENSWDIRLTPEQEFKNMPSDVLKTLIEIKCWAIIFWMGLMTSKEQKWTNRLLVVILGYFLVELILGK